jgi:hypothetical protein
MSRDMSVQRIERTLSIVSMGAGMVLVALAFSCAAPTGPPQQTSQPTAEEAPSVTGVPDAGRMPVTTSVPPTIEPQQTQVPQLAPAAPITSIPATSSAPLVSFPLGTATPSEQCGFCHVSIYREYAMGFGADLDYKGMIAISLQDPVLALPADHPVTQTAHGFAGVDPWPIAARQLEEGGKSCNVCHYPQPFEHPAFDADSIPKPQPRDASQEAVGVTCASCHLTPDGKIRGPFDVSATAPHATVQDPGMQSSTACALCHSMGPRVVGKQTQTFLEWREDFNKAGLGSQQCQDCHMPRTERKLAEAYEVPVRPVARHLWTGSHSTQRLASALHVAITRPRASQPGLEFHVTNIGAGHSVPTGSNRRAIYLNADVVDDTGAVAATQEWMFAPNFGDRPDDVAFVEDDKKGPEPVAAAQADAQGPHEEPVRAGEDRTLMWTPALAPGTYTVEATLVYDLNRYNDRAFVDDQTQIGRASLSVTIR